jgi:hypothetical protein
MHDDPYMNEAPTEGDSMQTQTSNVIRPLEWWQAIEMATARQLSEMRSAEIRKRIDRSVATLRAVR